jgi:hypothetical protein
MLVVMSLINWKHIGMVNFVDLFLCLQKLATSLKRILPVYIWIFLQHFVIQCVQLDPPIWVSSLQYLHFCHLCFCSILTAPLWLTPASSDKWLVLLFRLITIASNRSVNISMDMGLLLWYPSWVLPISGNFSLSLLFALYVNGACSRGFWLNSSAIYL